MTDVMTNDKEFQKEKIAKKPIEIIEALKNQSISEIGKWVLKVLAVLILSNENANSKMQIDLSSKDYLGAFISKNDPNKCFEYRWQKWSMAYTPYVKNENWDIKRKRMNINEIPKYIDVNSELVNKRCKELLN